jgi:aminopeptidase YwaD
MLLAGCNPAPTASAVEAEAGSSPGSTVQVDEPTAADVPSADTVPAPAAQAGEDGAAPRVEHDGQRAKEHVRALAERIGPRVAGTQAEAAAIQYIREHLATLGYDVQVFPFGFRDPFLQGSVRLDDQELLAWPMGGSGGGRASGHAADVGLARPEDVSGVELQGKVAVAQRGEITFGEKLANVQEAGAAGLVIVNNRPGPFLGALGREAGIPVVGARGEDGAALAAAARSGLVLSVEVPAGGESRSATVLAAASPQTGCQVLVGGHHDTVPDAPGANDNASGTANVLELARAFAADGLDEGLCFATFGAEESGLFGSRALVARLQADQALPRAMVNLDVTGRGSEVEVIGSAALVSQALGLAAQAGIPARSATMPAASGSDHESFSRAGVPVVFFTSGEFSAIHTPRDSLDGIQAEELDRVGDLAYATIDALLGNAQR